MRRCYTLRRDYFRAMYTQYRNYGLVCPTQLRLGIPRYCIIDNIDINPKTNTSKGSFHGAILSVLHASKESWKGTTQPTGAISKENVHNELPESCAIMLAELTKNVSEQSVYHTLNGHIQ